MFESKERGAENNTETQDPENTAFALWLFPGWFVGFRAGTTCRRSMSLADAKLFPAFEPWLHHPVVEKLTAMGYTAGLRSIVHQCEINNVRTREEHEAHYKAEIQKRALKKRRATLRAKAKAFLR